MTVLFLYTELADYFLKCCEVLSRSADVHIIRWPVNREAPFKFEVPPHIKIYDKQHYSFKQLQELVRSIDPQLIVCSGWIDKDYLKLTKPFYGKVPTVMTCDTRWTGALKQQLARVLSRFFLLNTFSHAWVPGDIQALYAGKLGFKADRIHKGFYCCDLKRFNALYAQQAAARAGGLPKRFLYAGRYYDFKGITDLWEAFIQLQQEEPNDWELWCLGTGSIAPVQHPKIRHFGFVQPSDLAPIVEQCGVFVLPSRFEPWAVVVQEYAASGFPLLLSDAVGAKSTFLEEEKNGFSFAPHNANDLKLQLKKIVNLPAKDLFLMSEISHRLAQKITPEQWAGTLMQIHDGFHKN